VLQAEDPALARRLGVNLPDEAARRVGQAIAAASLPEIKKKKISVPKRPGKAKKKMSRKKPAKKPK
jgi:hypothetical protein